MSHAQQSHFEVENIVAAKNLALNGEVKYLVGSTLPPSANPRPDQTGRTCQKDQMYHRLYFSDGMYFFCFSNCTSMILFDRWRKTLRKIKEKVSFTSSQPITTETKLIVFL